MSQTPDLEIKAALAEPPLAPDLQAARGSDLQFQPYTPEVIPAVLDLVQTALGSAPATPPTAEFWGWKHQANPFGHSYGVYAWDKAAERMAGLRVLMRWQFQEKSGEIVRAVRAVDTATHPGYRRQGLFSRLTQQAITELTGMGVHFIFNTPNQYSLPGYLKLGWQVVESWPVYLKILKPARFLFKLVWRGGTPQSASPFEAYFKPGVLSWGDFTGRYGEAIPALVTSWEKERISTGLRTRRDGAYLQWRYGRHPHLQYGVYPLEQDGELLGFTILRPNLRYGLKEIVLTELFLAEPELKLGWQLIKGLAGQLQGDYMAAHFARNTLERQLLRRAGFIPPPRRGMIFTVRPLNPLQTDPLSPAHWDLSLGDLEIF